MKRPQYVFRPNLNEPQHRRAWALLQQMPPAKRKEFLVQSILAAEYLLAALYNAPMTIENYYAAQIDHDLCGGKR